MMVTPAIIVSLLIFPWIVVTVMRRGERAMRSAGVLGVCLVFLFTGIGHFIKTEPMAQMLPGFVPLRTLLVIATGVLELLLAVLILLPAARRIIGLCLIVMLVLFLPANIYAAVERVPMGGHAWGPWYLAIRVPLQALLVGWTYYFAVRPQGQLQLTGDARDG